MHADGSCFLLKAIPNHSIQSPEVTSKASNDEELNDSVSVKALSAKLSEALLNIRAKEDLVKQHSKVAEEAVTGSSSFSFYVNFTSEISCLLFFYQYKVEGDFIPPNNFLKVLCRIDWSLRSCQELSLESEIKISKEILTAFLKCSHHLLIIALLDNMVVPSELYVTPLSSISL